jgi:hypothetical protein
MDDYISKPMRFQVLADTLRRWIPAYTAHSGDSRAYSRDASAARAER